MGIVIPNAILKNKSLSAIDKNILGLIYNCNCDICYLPQDVIREKLHYAMKNISNSLNKLEKMGFINYDFVEGKRYKLITCTDLFYTYYKRRENCKASYKEGYHKRRENKINFKEYKPENYKALTPEEEEEGRKLSKELLGK